jgi:hypothetical protein
LALEPEGVALLDQAKRQRPLIAALDKLTVAQAQVCTGLLQQNGLGLPVAGPADVGDHRIKALDRLLLQGQRIRLG